MGVRRVEIRRMGFAGLKFAADGQRRKCLQNSFGAFGSTGNHVGSTAEQFRCGADHLARHCYEHPVHDTARKNSIHGSLQHCAAGEIHKSLRNSRAQALT